MNEEALIEVSEFEIKGHRRQDFLSLHIMNQGKADSIILECPSIEDRKYIIIDAGSKGAQGSYRLIQDYLNKFLKCSKGKVLLVINSHCDNDHSIMISDVIQCYEPPYVLFHSMYSIYDQWFKSHPLLEDLLDNHCRNWKNGNLMDDINCNKSAVQEKYNFIGLTQKNWNKFDLETTLPKELKFQVLEPNDDFYNSIMEASDTSENRNNSSVVCKLEFPKGSGQSILLPGDLQKGGWDDLMTQFPKQKKGENIIFQSTILKVPHHGSEDATYDYVLQRIRPNYAVITSRHSLAEVRSKKYDGHHPDESVVSLLERGNEKTSPWKGTNNKEEKIVNPENSDHTYLTPDTPAVNENTQIIEKTGNTRQLDVNKGQGLKNISHIFCFSKIKNVTPKFQDEENTLRKDKALVMRLLALEQMDVLERGINVVTIQFIPKIAEIVDNNESIDLNKWKL